jgi:molybdenum cofactor biosynthesis enzyme MoaA
MSFRKELVDSFGRFHSYLRMSLTEKCNLRCQYCMPEHGVSLTPKDHLLSLDERKKLINLFTMLGVNKLRFTGGEPTVSNHLAPLIEYSSSLKKLKSIGITSNGILLQEQLPKFVKAGLSSVNISLDTLKAEKFGTITRRDGKLINRVQSSIFASLSHNIPTKINCVAIRGMNDDEFGDFVKYAIHYNLTIRFIELMPFDGNSWNKKQFISYLEIIDKLKNDHVSNLLLLSFTVFLM